MYCSTRHSLVILGQVDLILQLPCLKEQQAAIVSANNDALLRHPGVAHVVLWLHLLKVEGLQVALTVAEVAEDGVADDTQLGVVLGVETHLGKERRFMMMIS